MAVGPRCYAARGCGKTRPYIANAELGIAGTGKDDNLHYLTDPGYFAKIGLPV